MRISITTFLLIILCATIISAQEVRLRIAEQTGTVDIRYRDQEWQNIELDNFLSAGTEIQTGLHSRLSIEVGDQSFVTINQLSHVKIEKVRAKKNMIFTEFALKNGYVSVLSKSVKSASNTIVIQLDDGSVEFLNAGGDIYTRSEHGHLINSFIGKMKVISNVRDIYFLRKGMTCGITTDGLLIENEQFLRRDLATYPGDVLTESEQEAYFMVLTDPYSSESGTGDYYRTNRP